MTHQAKKKRNIRRFFFSTIVYLACDVGNKVVILFAQRTRQRNRRFPDRLMAVFLIYISCLYRRNQLWTTYANLTIWWDTHHFCGSPPSAVPKFLSSLISSHVPGGLLHWWKKILRLLGLWRVDFRLHQFPSCPGLFDGETLKLSQPVGQGL